MTNASIAVNTIQLITHLKIANLLNTLLKMSSTGLMLSIIQTFERLKKNYLASCPAHMIKHYLRSLIRRPFLHEILHPHL